MMDRAAAFANNRRAGQRAATAAGLCAILLWSTLAALSVSLSAVPPFQLMAISFAIGALTGLPQFWSRAQRAQLAGQLTPLAIAIGIGGLFGYHMFYFLSLSLAPPVEANLINYLWPLLIVLLSSFLPDVGTLSWRQIGGALLATAGAGAVLANGADLSAQNWMGYAAAFAAALVWASYSVGSRRFTQNVSSAAVAVYCAITSVLALAVHLRVETTFWPLTSGQWLCVAALGLGPLGVAFYFWDYGCKRGDIRTLGVCANATPILSTALLAIFNLAEAGPSLWLAAILIVTGAAITTQK